MPAGGPICLLLLSLDTDGTRRGSMTALSLISRRVPRRKRERTPGAAGQSWPLRHRLGAVGGGDGEDDALVIEALECQVGIRVRIAPLACRATALWSRLGRAPRWTGPVTDA
jgi:hypothetical protein